MIARRKFNHTVAGLLSKFLARDNDIDGYWTPGVLYTEARAAANRVELDLLGTVAAPASPACLSVARTWTFYLGEALGRHGISPDALAAASISIEFGLPLAQARPGYIAFGDPFQCSLRLLCGDGRELVRRKVAHCMPHEAFWGTRSTRRST